MSKIVDLHTREARWSNGTASRQPRQMYELDSMPRLGLCCWCMTDKRRTQFGYLRRYCTRMHITHSGSNQFQWDAEPKESDRSQRRNRIETRKPVFPPCLLSSSLLLLVFFFCSLDNIIKIVLSNVSSRNRTSLSYGIWF